jgi:hypothetical protein
MAESGLTDSAGSGQNFVIGNEPSGASKDWKRFDKPKSAWVFRISVLCIS